MTTIGEIRLHLVEVKSNKYGGATAVFRSKMNDKQWGSYRLEMPRIGIPYAVMPAYIDVKIAVDVTDPTHGYVDEMAQEAAEIEEDS